jgi:hypothetical protein
MDSGAFSTILTHGGFPDQPEAYAEKVRRWSICGNMLAAVTQDYMCEPAMLARTGLTVADHQRLTIERYDQLLPDIGESYLMPVLQGYEPMEYVSHIQQYGERLTVGAWVGVGSVCKRNSSVAEIESVLDSIKCARPDLRLHGFGLKATALRSARVQDALFSADSMAWSFAARKAGRNSNDWREAARFAKKIGAIPAQLSFAAIGARRWR